MNGFQLIDGCMVEKLLISTGNLEGDSAEAAAQLKSYIGRISSLDVERGVLTTVCSRCSVMFTLDRDRNIQPSYRLDCVTEDIEIAHNSGITVISIEPANGHSPNVVLPQLPEEAMPPLLAA